MKTPQHGMSLVTVMVVLLLSLIIVLGGFRTVLFHEMLQGSNSDYQRTFAAAEALLRDAEIDIVGQLPPYTTVQPDGSRGELCRWAGDINSSGGTFIGCRESDVGMPWFARTNAQFNEVRDLILAASSNGNGSTVPCLQGICVPSSSDPSALITGIEHQLNTLRPLAACYGQYTQRVARATNPDWSAGNPVLRAQFDTANRCIQAQAWYWVEAFRHSDEMLGSPAIDAALRPDPAVSVVYRITALAQGLKPGSQIILRSLFVPYPAQQNQ